MKSGFVYLIVTTEGQFETILSLTWLFLLIGEENQLLCARRSNKSELAHWLMDSAGIQRAKLFPLNGVDRSILTSRSGSWPKLSPKWCSGIGWENVSSHRPALCKWCCSLETTQARAMALFRLLVLT